MTCFDPLYRIGNQMAETFAAHTAWNAQEIRTCCLKILDQMQILNGEEVLENILISSPAVCSSVL